MNGKFRHKNHGKACSICLKDNPEETKLQQTFTKDIKNYIKQVQDKYYEENPITEKRLTSYVHIHICAFKLLSNNKHWCATQCKKQIQKLPELPNDWLDYCDICPKMTYIAFDNDLNVVYAMRTFTEEIV